MGTDGVTVALRDSVRNCKSSGVSLRIIVVSTFQMFWACGPQHEDLHDVAWLATVEAETMMRVSLHQMGVIQVHGLGD